MQVRIMVDLTLNDVVSVKEAENIVNDFLKTNQGRFNDYEIVDHDIVEDDSPPDQEALDRGERD